MSRNDQVIRQWFLLQKLGSERGATLQELATALPEDCSRHPRTIRRDLEALEAAHFPLLTERVVTCPAGKQSISWLRHTTLAN
ncbi:MAG TPA: hypothetical protein VKK81_22940 [Candidatus Binatia bacterium]|nr:hypothetical protein [Candidatus Binatia bacterium]